MSVSLFFFLIWCSFPFFLHALSLSRPFPLHTCCISLPLRVPSNFYIWCKVTLTYHNMILTFRCHVDNIQPWLQFDVQKTEMRSIPVNYLHMFDTCQLHVNITLTCCWIMHIIRMMHAKCSDFLYVTNNVYSHAFHHAWKSDGVGPRCMISAIGQDRQRVHDALNTLDIFVMLLMCDAGACFAWLDDLPVATISCRKAAMLVLVWLIWIKSNYCKLM